MNRQSCVTTRAILITFSLLLSGMSISFGQEVHLFLLAGQSNMNSANPSSDLPPPMDQPLFAVKIWVNGANTWADLSGGFGKAPQPPLWVENFGPEVSFGHRLAEELTKDFRIVKFAQGNTSLAWNWNPDVSGSLYERLIFEARAAIDNLEAAGHDVRVAGMMWMQGGNDAWDMLEANAYEGNLSKLIEHVRADLAAPLMPIIIGRIHDKHYPSFPYAEVVRTAQMNVAAADVMAAWIDTDSFSLRDDNVHFDSQGIIDLGRAFARSYLDMPGNFVINPGLNDAWVSEDAPMQGFFFTVFPNLELFFLSWFTFDSVIPDPQISSAFGAPDQRWVTGLGSYSGNSVTINVELTSGGIFNDSIPLADQEPGYGTITIVFNSCSEAILTFDFPSPGLSGQMTLTRALPDNIALCEALNADNWGHPLL